MREYLAQFRGDEPAPEELLVEIVIQELKTGTWDFPTLLVSAESWALGIELSRVRQLVRRAIYEYWSEGWIIWPVDKPYTSGPGVDGDVYDTRESAEEGMWVTAREKGYRAIRYVPGGPVKAPKK